MGTLSSGLSRDTLAWLKLTAFKTCVSNWHCLGATIELSAQEQYFFFIFTLNTAWLMTGAWSARKPEIWPTSPRSSGTASSWSVQWIGKQVFTVFPTKMIKLRSWMSLYEYDALNLIQQPHLWIHPSRYASQKQFWEAAKKSPERTDPVLLRRLHVSNFVVKRWKNWSEICQGLFIIQSAYDALTSSWPAV